MTNLNRSWRVALSRVLRLYSFLVSVAHADQILLKNGDRVTGSIVKKDGPNLVVRSDLFGVVTIAWDKLESVKTDTAVTVSTKDGKTVQGSLALANGTVEVAAAGDRESVPAADVTAIRNADEQRAFERLERPAWAQLWVGTGTVGWSGSKGNAQTLTLTTGLNAQRITRNDKTTLYINTINASARPNGKNSKTAQAARGGIAYDHNLGSRLFINTFNDYEYDRFQNLDLRFVVGIGAGFHAVKTDRTLLNILGGSDYNHSSFSTPDRTESAEIYLGDDYTRKLGKLATFNQSARLFNDLTHTGGYRVNFDAGTSVRLTRWLNWNLSLSDRYLSTPAFGRKPNDILYTTGMGFSFAR